MISQFFLLARGKAFSCLPAIFDYLSGVKKSSIVTVVPPLVAIMKDQVCYTWSC